MWINMYQITYTLPESKHTKSQLLRMDDKQAKLNHIINKNFFGIATLKTERGELFITFPSF
jgi:hypothetical protein